MKPKLRFQGFHDDWEEKKLGEIAEIKAGKDLDKKKLIDKGFPVFGNALNDKGLLGFYSDYEFVNDAITVTGRGDIGKAFYRKGKFNTVGRLISVCSNQHPYFLAEAINRIKIFNESTGVPQLTALQLKEYKTFLPSLSEQEKIGAFLSQLDDRIEKQEQKIALLKERKKGWMQQLFSQTIRFKDENGQDYPAWEEKKINDIYNITRGKVLSKKEIQEIGRYPVYSSQTLNHGLLGYYDHYLFENAITWTTDGANAGTVNYREGKFYCTNVCGVLLNDEGYSNQCMSELLNSIAFKHVSRVGNPKLMNNVMSEIIIPVPSLPEQEKIAEFLSKQDELIEKEEEKLSLLKEQKKGFLQQMFI